MPGACACSERYHRSELFSLSLSFSLSHSFLLPFLPLIVSCTERVKTLLMTTSASDDEFFLSLPLLSHIYRLMRAAIMFHSQRTHTHTGPNIHADGEKKLQVEARVFTCNNSQRIIHLRVALFLFRTLRCWPVCFVRAKWRRRHTRADIDTYVLVTQMGYTRNDGICLILHLSLSLSLLHYSL